jgi:outer membrane protein assembly factor BamB
MTMLATAFLGGLLAAAPQATTAQSAWPHWLGPTRDGRAASTAIPESGPVRLKEAWRRPIGVGTSGLSIAGGTLVTLDSDEKGAGAIALSTKDGSVLWRVPLDDDKLDPERGPASTPAVSSDLAYVVTPGCQLRALALADGKPAWNVDLKAQFGANPTRGCSTSPLLEGDSVIVQTAAPDDKRVAALDRRTGAPKWAAKGVARSNYSAPGVRSVGAAREVLVHHTDISQGDPRGGVSAFRAGDGTLAWQHTLDKSWSLATPVPLDADRVLVMTWNDAALVKTPAAAAGPSVLWRTPGLTAFIGTPVYRDGHIYGHGGDYLRCIRASDGSTAWEERVYPGSVTLAGSSLVALSINAGLLRVVEATPAAYRERARLQTFEPGSSAETPPSVVGRRIYVRNDEEVVAVDVEQ